MHPLIQKLLPGPVVTDGAWGTQLQALGLRSGECPDAWNLTCAEKVETVARAYVEAGSRVILTNTFGGSRLQLANHGLADRTVAINRAGVEISLRAAAGRALVFASVGPTGKMLATEETTEEELRRVYEEQADALAQAGADGLVLETFADLDEARIAIVAAKRTSLPVVASFVFDTGANRDRTMMGATPEQAAELAASAGADVVGANCGRGIGGFVAICGRLRAATTLPVWIKANAGLPEMVNGRAVYATKEAFFAEKAAEVVAEGATFIGGCCGTSPAFIAAVVKKLTAG
jgi:methionine synthase I (cobalamin-dependent)